MCDLSESLFRVHFGLTPHFCLECLAIISSIIAKLTTPWEEIQTVQQVQARLAESQRICNAYLDTWPEQPHLDTTVTLGPLLGPMNAIGTHMFAIGHVYMHYEQLKEIVQQAATVNKA